MRTCIGCRGRRPQSELLRFALDPSGTIVQSRTMPGRGAWLCKVTLESCRAKADRRDAFTRAFRRRSGSVGHGSR